MNSRSLVKKTIGFDNPPRIPRHLWTLPWAKLHYEKELAAIQDRFSDDICWSPNCLKQQPKVSGVPYNEGEYIDEWGCVFENRQAGIVGEVKVPLLASWNDLDKVRIPTEFLNIDIEQINAFCMSSTSFVLAGCAPRPFERLQFIRGTDNIFIDLIDQPSQLIELVNKLHQFYLAECQLWAKTDVDGLFFMDDWGSQNALLIAPELWRKLFKPLYKDYIDIAHQHGKYAFMHSDGYIKEILPDFIEIGLDAINCQIFCMDVADLGRKFKGKITFWGEIDRQHILSNATRDEVTRAVQLVKSSLYHNGGVIAQCEFGPGAKPRNVYTVFETWDKG